MVHRDVLLVMRRKSEVLTALFFFVIVTSLFPLGIGAEPNLLRKIAPGVLWVAALLSTMLGLQRMFANDYLDGTLEQMALSPTPLVILVRGKIIAHWIVSGLPLLILAPLIGIQFDLGRGGGVLLSLLILPLYIPVLIFGAGAVYAFDAGLDIGGHLSLLAALLIFSLLGSPWVASTAIRIATE